MSNVRSVAPFKSRYNAFDHSHSVDLSLKFGYAYPVLIMPFTPGTSYNINWSQLCRMMPLNTPAFSKVRMRFDAFRCDQHEVWPNFENFVKQVGDEENPIVAPYITVPNGGFAKGTLPDYLGFAIGTGDGDHVDATIFRHYANIITNYYHNTNIQDDIVFSTADGADITTPITLQKVNYRPDRFVGAEVTTQRGESTILPIGTEAPVIGNGDPINMRVGTSTTDYELKNSNYSGNNKRLFLTDSSDNEAKVSLTTDATKSGMYADISQVAGVEVNLLNTVERLNQYKIYSLLAGRRYPDWQRVMYDVPSSDARLQIPDWLGSYKAPFVISEVLQTSQSTESSPQGSMAGHGFSQSNAHLYIPRLNSFGYIIIIMTVMPSVVYDQGLPAMYNKFNPYEYLNPMMAKLPMQELPNSELYWQANTVVDDDGKPVNDVRFGFCPPYDDYRYRNNRCCGEFHDNFADMIVRRHFDALPVLNEAFIQADDDLGKDLFADTEHDYLYAHIDWDIKCVQKLPRTYNPAFFG